MRGSAAKVGCELKKVSRLYNAKTGVGCDGFRPKVQGFDKRYKRHREVLGVGGAECKMAAASLYDDVLLDSEECYE